MSEETKLDKYDRLFAEWKLARNKADSLYEQWNALANELRLEMESEG